VAGQGSIFGLELSAEPTRRLRLPLKQHGPSHVLSSFVAPLSVIESVSVKLDALYGRFHGLRAKCSLSSRVRSNAALTRDLLRDSAGRTWWLPMVGSRGHLTDCGLQGTIGAINWTAIDVCHDGKHQGAGAGGERAPLADVRMDGLRRLLSESPSSASIQWARCRDNALS